MPSRRPTPGVVLGVLLLSAVLAWLIIPTGDERSSPDPRLSSLRASPQGARALSLTLEGLGIRVQPRFTPYVGADSLAGPLALMAPSTSPSPDELHALLAWVEQGGTLLYVARPGDATLDSLGLRLAPAGRDTTRAPAPRPRAGTHPWTHDVPTPGASGVRFARGSAAWRAGAVPLVEDSAGGVAVLRMPRGRGAVVAWSDAAPFRNRALRESGAALLFARAAAEAARGGSLHFDEYHHGYRGGGSAAAGTWAFLRQAPLGHALLQLLAVALGVLRLAGRRLGAPHASAPRERRSPLEQVDALAGAYRQAGARRTARRLLLAGLARRLGWPAPPRSGEAAPLAKLESTALASRPGARALRQEYARGERAELVALARHIDHLIDEVEHR